MKAEVDKLDIDKLVNVPSGLNNLKIRVDDLGVSRLKTVPVDLKKLSGAVSKYRKENIKDAKFNKLNTKVYNLENKISDASNLIQTKNFLRLRIRCLTSLVYKHWRS